MTSRDLVRAAIAHQETPRVPYCIGYTADGARELQRLIGTQRSADEFTDNDVVRVAPPWWHWHQLGADWARPQTPVSRQTVRGGGSYEEYFDQLKRLHDETGKYLLVTVYGSHFEKANFSRGIENFLADLAGDPPFARRLLRRIIDRNLVMLENALSCPEADGVLLGSDWGSQVDLLMSPQTWQEMIRPGEQEEYDLVHSFGLDVWIHSCGNVQRIIPDLIEMGVQVLNPVQPECMDLRALKEAYGQRLTFWGGVSTQQTLPYGTPDQVRVESRRVRELLGRGGGYVFAPAQEIQGDVSAENILALIEVAREAWR
ncbi:MAG: uroporphyrinogen decarboxylase family protein [Candidatus Latescibacterota bacterium]